MTQEEINILIEKCLNNDIEAFESIVYQYERLVYATAYRMLNNHSDAQDVTQEVFIKVYQKIHLYKPTYTFGAWITTITSNACIDYIRKNKKRTIFSLDKELEFADSSVKVDIESKDATPEEILITNEKKDQLIRAIDMLDYESKQLIILRDVNSIPYGDIADLLGLKLGTVKSKISRSRAKLQKIILEFQEQNLI